MSSKNWQDVRPHPWRRYAARAADLIILGTVMWFLIGVIFGLVAPEAAEYFFSGIGQFPLLEAMLNIVFAIPITAVFIATLGLSPGKWIFGVRVSKDGRPIGLAEALKREVSVLVFGWGLGLPIVSIFTLIRSFTNLKVDGETRWDARGGYVVTHRPQTMIATGLMWFAFVVLATVTIGLKLLLGGA
ncbi:MAG: RDD family protein [Pseudomonadota bacterium]|uniref:RDD family protein n=1 Tax=Phenylobacterium sp. TaxID=1871053 RepID=UPI0027213DBD|nr:RDD family protein [Phenylobacterium sp.]MDO9432896.1 RDD family protein [Phenylobacterium sp.]